MTRGFDQMQLIVITAHVLRTHPDFVGTGVLVDFEDRVVVRRGGSIVRFLVRSRFIGAHGDSTTCSLDVEVHWHGAVLKGS